jgi:hydroxymethylpyrimidine/phosphomethylpyrimidine kinase
MHNPPVVMVLSGLDPTGGAGLLADIRALAAAGVRIAPLITANTLQGRNCPARFQPVDSRFLSEQLNLVYQNFKPAAVKIGMTGSIENTRVVHAFLKSTELPSVLDPVMQASSGGALISDGMVDAMLKMAGRITLLTPNRDELASLTGTNIRTERDVFPAVKALTGAGFESVLVKGGHFAGDPRDLFFSGGELLRSFGGRRYTRSVRGTGCHLASGIAAMLALGQNLENAVENGYNYVQRVLTDYYCAGNGILPADAPI